ncbi:MAG: T9SS type A sorting domain-containing protein [Flavobacteriales bacterium]|jgi:hypothetical protein|nr:T9SS type A sorting domain-containing protein [Flavobacteriales bacterium]
MKKLLVTLFLLSISISSFAQTLDFEGNAGQQLIKEVDILKIYYWFFYKGAKFGTRELSMLSSTEMKLEAKYEVGGFSPALPILINDSIFIPNDSLPSDLEYIYVHSIAIDSYIMDTIVYHEIDTINFLKIGLPKWNVFEGFVQNPVGDFLQISSPHLFKEMTIIDIQGKEVYRGNYQSKLEVSFLPRGYYLLRFLNEKGIFVRKVYKE